MTDQQVFSTVFTAEIGDVLTKLTNMIKGVLELASTSTTLASAMGLSDNALKSFTETLKKAENVAAQFETALGKVGLNSKGMNGALGDAKNGIAGVSDASEKGTLKSQEYLNALSLLKSGFGYNQTALKGLNSELGKLDNTYQQAMLRGDEHSEGVRRSYTATNLAGEAINNYIAKSNLAVPAVTNVTNAHKQLESTLSLTEFKTTSLGKAFLSTSSKGDNFYEALLKGGEAYGSNTTKTDQYIKSLSTVEKHLQSIPSSSVNAKSAQMELGDSMMMAQRATELMSGSIVKVKDGFEAIGSKVKASGTVMGEYGQTLVTLNSHHKNLSSSFQEYTETQKGNTSAIQTASDRLTKYTSIVDQVRAKYKDVNLAVAENNNGTTVYGETVIKAGVATKQMQTDQGFLKASLYNTAQIQKVLTGEQELSIEAVVRAGIANKQHRAGMQELLSEYNGLNKGLKDVSQYGVTYAESLKTIASATNGEKASIEQAVTAHMNYAKTSEGLIAQSKVLTDATVRKIQTSAEYSQNLEAGNAAIQAAKAGHESLATALRSTQAVEIGVSREGGNVRDAMLGVARSMGVSAQQTDNLQSAASRTINVTEKYRAVAESLNKEIESGRMSNAEAVRAMDAHKASVIANEAEMKRAKQANDEHNASLKQTPGLLSKISQTIENFAVYQIASTAIGAITGAITGAVSTIMTFDQTLHSLKAITGATSIEMSGMSDVIKETSASSRYSVEQIGQGLEIMGQAGLTASQSMQTIKAATTLATGTLEKMGNVVDLLTSTMSAYNLDVTQAAHITDVMATACNRSKMDIDKLRTSLNYVGVIAAQSGLSLEQTTSSLMVLADRGMRASTIGTGLRQVLDKLIAPNEKLREAYQAHGISLDKISPLTAGYEEALKNLTKTLYSSETGLVDTAKAFELFGIRGAQAATILIQSYASGEWKKTVDSLSEVGTAAKMAEEQMLGLSALWENLVAKVKVLAVGLGEGGLEAVLKGVIRVFSSFIDVILEFQKFDFGFIGYITSSLIGLAAVLGAASLGMGLYSAIVAQAAIVNTFFNAVVVGTKTAFNALTAAMLMNPFGMVATLVLAVGASFKILLSYLSSVVESHNKTASSATEMANSIGMFSKVVRDSGNDVDKLKVSVSRVKSEYPELAVEIAKVTGVSDIATLSYEKLTEAMGKVREAKLNEAIAENIKALSALQTKEQVMLGIDFLVGNAWKNIVYYLEKGSAGFGNMVGSVSNWISAALGGASATEVLSKEMKEQAKTGAESYVNAGRIIEGSIESQKQISLEKLASDRRLGLISKALYDEMAKYIGESYQKIGAYQQMSQVKYEKFVNSVGGQYKNLSAIEKEQILTVQYEEEKAIEKYKKYANDKGFANEETEAGIYAITLDYQEKKLNALKRFTKKEYETTEEKQVREQAFLNERLQQVTKEIAAEQAIVEKGLSHGTDANQAELNEFQSHKNKLEMAEFKYQDLIRKQQNLTFEHNKTLMTNFLAEVKSNAALELALNEDNELKKIQIQAETADLTLRAQKALIDAQIKELERLKKAHAITADDEKAALDRIAKEKIKEQELTADSITKNVAQGKYWLEKMNEFQDKHLEHVKDSYKDQEETLKSYYENELLQAKNSLEKKKSLVDLGTNKDENKIYSQKLKLEMDYYAKEFNLIKEEYDAKSKLSQQEFAETQKLLQEKLNANNDYNSAVKALSVDENTSIKSKYDEQTQFLLKEITKRGATVEHDIATRGYAEVKVSETEKAELKKRGISFVQYADGIYKVIEQKNLVLAKAAGDESKFQRSELEKQEKNLRVFIDKEIKDKTEEVEKTKKLIADETAAYLAEQQNLKKARETTRNDNIKFEEAIRQVKQGSMTDSQKYSDDLKSINDDLMKYRMKGDKTYLDSAVSKTNSLTTSEIISDGRIASSAKQTQDKKISLLREEESLTKTFNQNAERNIEASLKSREQVIKEQTDSLNTMKKELENFKEQKVSLDADKFFESTASMMIKIDEVVAKLGALNGTPIDLNISLAEAKLKKLKEDLQSVQDIEKVTNENNTNKIPEIPTLQKTGYSKYKDELSIDIVANSDGEKVPIADAFGNVEKSAVVLGGILSAMNPNFVTNFMAKVAGSIVDFFEGSAQVESEVAKFQEDKEATLTVNVDPAMQKLQSVDEFISKLQAKMASLGTSGGSSGDTSEDSTDSAGNQRVGGWIGKRIGGFISYLRNGGPFTGSLPGYGGGDIVNARLEPGEFVLRKEAVSKIGVNALREWNNLNSSALKSLNPQTVSTQNESMFSGQLHTINLNIGNVVHKVYGDSNVLNSLTSSLRRSRLMTA